MPGEKRRVVWSSSDGDQRKRQRVVSPSKTFPQPNQQTAYLHRESKGRGGKGVSLVKNLSLSEKDMKALAKKLKQACGTGGTVKNGIIEIQGEQREKIAETLKKLGYQVKIAGG